MFSLPTTVTVNGRTLHIRNNGDYRMILDCFNALSDGELSEDLRVLASLLIFYNEFTCVEDVDEFADCLDKLVEEMYKFINCGQVDSPGKVTNKPLLDWSKDEQMICAAVNNVAKQEVRSLEYLHWWTFMGYFLSVGESVMSTVVSIRDKIVHHKKLEKWEQEFKRSNPDYFVWNMSTIEDKEAENIIRDLWNKE